MISENPKQNLQFPRDLLMALKDPVPFHMAQGTCPIPCVRFLEQIFPSRPTWMRRTISPGRGAAIAHSPGRRVMKLEIKGVGATIPDHGHLWGKGRERQAQGPEAPQEFHWEGMASRGRRRGSRELPSDCLPSLHCRSTAPPTWPASVLINCWPISVLFPRCSLTLVPREDEPIWDRR